MKIIYHCQVSKFLTLFSAFYHLKYKKNPDLNKLFNFTFQYLTNINLSSKNLIYIDKDDYCNKIFILNHKNRQKIICQTIMGFSKIFNIREKYTFMNLEKHENLFLKFSGLVSKIPFIKLTEKKVIWIGIKKEYNMLQKYISNFFKKIEH